MATTTPRRRTDYGFLWVLLALALLMLSIFGVWAWLISKVRRVAPRKLWAIWILIGTTFLLLAAWAWGAATSESGALAEAAKVIAATWYQWLPDVVALYVVTCATVMVVERNQSEQTQRRLAPDQLRLWVWFWVSPAVTLAMAGWAVITRGQAHPGEVGFLLGPALSLDPNFLRGRTMFGVQDPEALLVTISVVSAFVLALRFRSRTKGVLRLALSMTALAVTASAVDAATIGSAEAVGVFAYGAVLFELWRRRRWFFR